MGFVRILFAFLVALALGVVAVTAIHTQFVIAAFEAVGGPIDGPTRLDWTLKDIVGMNDFSAPSELLPAILAIGFLIAFILAGLISRLLKPLRVLVFMVAGAGAVIFAFVLMKQTFDITPVAGARGMIPTFAHGLGGLLAGLVYAAVTPGPRRD